MMKRRTFLSLLAAIPAGLKAAALAGPLPKPVPAASGLTMAKIMKAKQLLEAQEIPGPRWMIISPEQWNELKEAAGLAMAHDYEDPEHELLIDPIKQDVQFMGCKITTDPIEPHFDVHIYGTCQWMDLREDGMLHVHNTPGMTYLKPVA